jgi:LEA14-like dessication related protein
MKKLLKIVLIILIIINLFITLFLFYDFQVFESPETIVSIDVVKINSEELVLQTKMDINNPNSFDLTVSDFIVSSKTIDGISIGELSIEGGTIAGKQNETFISIDKFALEGQSFKTLKNEITGKIGIKILGIIQKTIPVKIIILTSIEEIINSLESPVLNVEAFFDDINSKGLNFSASINVYNPTDFEYTIGSLNLNLKTDDNIDVGNITIFGDTILPKSSLTFSSKGTVSYNALDAKILLVKLSGVAGARIAGMYQEVKLSTVTQVKIPNIQEFIFKNQSIDFYIPVQIKLTAKGILVNLGFKFFNPSDIPLLAKNLVCSVLRVDGDDMTLLGDKKMDPCQLIPENIVCVKTQILISYLTYITKMPGKILPDWLVIKIHGDFSIAGTRQAFPITLNAYIDPNLINQKELI